VTEELPKGWVWATIDDLQAAEARAITDGPFGSNLASRHYTDTGARVIRLQNIGDGNFIDERAYISPEHFETLNKHEVRQGDIVIASLGNDLPRATIVPDLGGPAIVKADCIRFRPSPLVSPAWILYALRAPYTKASVQERVRGIGRPRLGLGAIRKISIPVPPADEQKRIAEALEAELTRLDAAENQLQLAEMRLGRLRSRIISELCSGRKRDRDTVSLNDLDGGGEKKPQDLPSGWSRSTLGEVVNSVKNGIFVPRAKSDPDGVPILRIGAVRTMSLDLGDLRYSRMSVEDLDAKDALLKEGDLLFTRYNGNPDLVGSCVVVSGVGDLTYPDKLIRVRVNTNVVLPSYVELVFSLREVKREVKERVRSTAGQAGISGSDLREVEIPIPPISEQERIVSRVQGVSVEISRIRKSLQRSYKRADNLRRALLSAAFTGKLVPQDPSEEPASTLLDRIRAERAAVPKSTRGKSASVKAAVGGTSTSGETNTVLKGLPDNPQPVHAGEQTALEF
jgi:type I restriction enzyme S subunit